MIPSADTMTEVSEAQLGRYASLIYEKTGIRLAAEKRALLSNRVRRRLRETGIPTFDGYLIYLKSLPPKDPEWSKFFQEVTTHETYLFRDEDQWDWFRRDYLPSLAKEAMTGKRPQSLRIWSAACSTGDEATTVACCVASHLQNFSQWKVSILGTDIGPETVKAATQATFGERAMRFVPAELKRKWFTLESNKGNYRANDVLTGMMSFRQHNLLERLPEKPFDLIILKNVLIYFDADSKAKVMANLLPQLAPGGLLMLGGAEGVHGLLQNLERVHFWLYRKPAPVKS